MVLVHVLKLSTKPKNMTLMSAAAHVFVDLFAGSIRQRAWGTQNFSPTIRGEGSQNFWIRFGGLVVQGVVLGVV